MRRIVVVATALAVLTAAASAFAATGGLNDYTGSALKFSPNKASTALGFTQKYIANGTNGNRTAPLTDIKTTIYGMKSDGKDFPTCSKAKITAAGNDTGCPKGALVAKGAITAILGPQSDQSSSAPGQLPCDPVLDVWNAGQGQVVYFFVDEGSHTCAGGAITTGEVGAFTGTIKTVGKNLVMNTPIPGYVSFPLAGVEGSLTSETLVWKNLSTKLKNGKTAHYGVSTACKSGKRPYTVAFTAETAASGGTSSTQTVTGTQKCS